MKTLRLVLTLGIALGSIPARAATIAWEPNPRDLTPISLPPAMANATPDKIRRFFESRRYKNLYRSNEQFLADVYQVVLGRRPDAKGYADWLSAINNPRTERSWVVRSFLESAEYRGAHPPKPKGSPEPCATSRKLAERLGFGGPAFFSKAEYKDLKKSDLAFLKDAYCLLLKRAPDDKGLADWLLFLRGKRKSPSARGELVSRFVKSPEYAALHPAKSDGARHPGNRLFDATGLFVNDAGAFTAEAYAPAGGADLLEAGRVSWIALQIDNGGKVREDNAAAVRAGWAEKWKARGYKVGFWGVPRGAGYDATKLAPAEREAALASASKDTASDARLAARLSVELKGDFYIADCEGHFQYGQGDPALNAVYVDAFERAAPKSLPRALSSMGRVDLAMEPWIKGGWDALPQAYWNSYEHYRPTLSVDYYVGGGWPLARVHPTIATYRGEGEDRAVSLQDYAADLAASKAPGFSYYLPESYLGADPARWRELGALTPAAEKPRTAATR